MRQKPPPARQFPPRGLLQALNLRHKAAVLLQKQRQFILQTLNIRLRRAHFLLPKLTLRFGLLAPGFQFKKLLSGRRNRRLRLVIGQTRRRQIRLHAQSAAFSGCCQLLRFRQRGRIFLLIIPIFQHILQNQIDFLLVRVLFKLQISFRPAALLGQWRQTRRQLADNIPDTRQILLRISQLALRRLFPGAIFHNAGRVLQKQTAFVRFHVHNLLNTPLPNQSQRIIADAAVHKQLADIGQPALAAIQQIFRITVPICPATNGNRRKFQRQRTVRIINIQNILSIRL